MNGVKKIQYVLLCSVILIISIKVVEKANRVCGTMHTEVSLIRKCCSIFKHIRLLSLYLMETVKLGNITTIKLKKQNTVLTVEQVGATGLTLSPVDDTVVC